MEEAVVGFRSGGSVDIKGETSTESGNRGFNNRCVFGVVKLECRQIATHTSLLDTVSAAVSRWECL
jgi:hypothetical protein